MRGNESPVRDASVLERIERLRIPPAWREVHIATSSRSAVQAWGFDARGRRQYRYHPRAVERGELRKYHRVRRMAHDLPRIRRGLAEDCRRKGMPHDKVAAAVVWLIGEGFFRVGGERYARENRTVGIATMRKTHVEARRDCLVFRYSGKGAIRQRQVITEPKLVRLVASLRKSPGRRLFRYEQDGRWHDLTAAEINEYIHRRFDVPYTAKDFRTWGGTLRMATVLAELGPPKSAREANRNVVMGVRLVAAELGNTPTICRKSYVHPIVIAKYLDEGITIGPALERVPRRRERFAHAPEERALIQFLDRFFPDRRRQRASRTAGRSHVERRAVA